MMSAEMFQQQLMEQQQVILQLQQQLQSLQQQASLSFHQASTSSVSMPVKVAKPSTFSGHFRANIELWLFEMGSYLSIMKVPEESRVQLVGSYLKDTAALWYKYVFEESLTTGVPLTWKSFQVKLLQRFRPIESSKTARVALASLRQVGSVQHYCNTFQQFVTLTSDMAETDKVFAFQRGLKPHIAREVDLREPNTLSEAMNYAIRADARNSLLFRSSVAPSYFNKLVGARSTPMEVENVNLEFQHDEEPATEVSMVNAAYTRNSSNHRPNEGKRNHISIEDRDRCMKERRCFNCKQMGHSSKQCKNLYSKNF
jgi:hypothetical protein